MIRLHHIPLSPFCRKLRLVLAEKALPFELVETRPWERRAAFLKMAPSGEVPALEIDVDADAVEGEPIVLSDSAAIVEYLEETAPDRPLWPEGFLARAEARRIAQWMDGKFHREVTANLLHERIYKRLKGGGEPDSAAMRRGLAEIRTHIDYLDWLLRQRDWLAGDRLTIADCAAAAHFSALDYTGDVPWDRAPAAKEWYARIKSRPSFRPLLADRVVGLVPAPHYQDLDF